MKNLFNNNISELFIKLLPVQIFVALASSLSNMVNGYIISANLDANALNAMGLVTPLIAILSAIAFIVSGGSGILCGNYLGRGEHKKIDQVFSIAVIMLTVSGIVLTIGMYIFAPQIADLLKTEAELFDSTVAYIKGTSIGVIPTLLTPTFMSFMQMLNKSNLSLASVILMAVINAILSLMSINLFHGGIFGVGVATSLSKIIIALLLFSYLVFKKDMTSLKLNTFDGKLAVQMLKLGSPASLAGILYSIRNVFINSFSFDMAGTNGVNSQAVLASFGGLFDSINIGIGSTLTMLASVFIGERDSKSLKRLIKITAAYGLFLTMLKVVFAYVFGRQIAVMYDATDVELTYDLIRLYGWSAPPNILTIILISILSSMGRVGICNMLYVYNCLIAPLIICCTILGKFIGIKAVWSCYMLAEFCTLSLYLIINTIKRKHFPRNLDDIFEFEKHFNDVNKYSISIKNVQEVVSVSKNIETLCKNNGIDSRRAMLAGLCMEEMAGNIVEHGFEKDNKENTIDVFACVENDEVYLRLRDNCVPFDPKSKNEIYNPEDPCKNIGIRMVAKLAKEMNYQPTFGMNVLSIKL